MARYIDADELIKKIFPYDVVDKKRYAINAEAVYKAIQNVTTADVAEVVRCKDCKKWRETEDEEFLFCMHFADTVGTQAYCSYGERKEKKKAIYLRFSNHDCEAWYECPCCGTRFGSWRICGQEPNENGTEKYCPHCKEELDGLD